MESVDRKDLHVRYIGILQIALLIAIGMLVAVMDQAENKFHFMKPTSQPTNRGYRQAWLDNSRGMLGHGLSCLRFVQPLQ